MQTLRNQSSLKEKKSNSQSTLLKKERKDPIVAIRNEKDKIKMDTTQIHKIISNYFKNLNTNKSQNAETMDRFLYINDLLKLNQEDI